MKNRILWLNAADNLVDAYLNPAAQRDFNAVSVLSALEHTADALYYLDHSLYSFIKEHARRWFNSGMTEPANFTTQWQQLIPQCD